MFLFYFLPLSSRSLWRHAYYVPETKFLCLIICFCLNLGGSEILTDPTFLYPFTVKALYDYQATIDEEFDFQTGDIIAVTATPDDGWWSGELLDEARRQRGRYIFPSNFVCLF